MCRLAYPRGGGQKEDPEKKEILREGGKKEKAEDDGIHVTRKKIRGPWEGRRDQRGVGRWPWEKP